MRKQYHFRPGPEGLRSWDVDRLVALTQALPVIEVPLAEIRELDESYWYGGGAAPTCRSLLEHMRLVQQAELRYPIILSSDGGVMDGMHRVLKAVLEGRSHISAKQFRDDPAPDHVGRGPDELPYPDQEL